MKEARGTHRRRSCSRLAASSLCSVYPYSAVGPAPTCAQTPRYSTDTITTITVPTRHDTENCERRARPPRTSRLLRELHRTTNWITLESTWPRFDRAATRPKAVSQLTRSHGARKQTHLMRCSLARGRCTAARSHCAPRPQ